MRYSLCFLLLTAMMTAALPLGAQPKGTQAKPAPAKKTAPCQLAFDEVDDFDNQRTVGSKPINFGLLMPSLFETETGPKLIEEGKFIFMYSHTDSIYGFFMTLAIPEYEYQPISNDYNVYVKLVDSEEEVFRLYNVPDQGTFDKNTNMRVYQHTCIVPIDTYYRFAHHKIEKIRIAYKNQKRTISLNAEQQDRIQKAIRCVGEAVDMWPAQP